MGTIHKERQWFINSAKLIYSLMIFMSILYIVSAYGIRNEIPEKSLYAIYFFSALNLFVGVALRFINYSKVDTNFIFFIIFFNIVMEFLMFYFFGTNRTFKTPAYVLPYVWIMISIVSGNKYAVLYSGLTAIMGYLVLLFIALGTNSVDVGSITQSFNSPVISLKVEILKIVFVGMFTGIAYIITGWLHKKFIEQHNAKINGHVCYNFECDVRTYDRRKECRV